MLQEENGSMLLSDLQICDETHSHIKQISGQILAALDLNVA